MPLIPGTREEEKETGGSLRVPGQSRPLVRPGLKEKKKTEGVYKLNRRPFLTNALYFCY